MKSALAGIAALVIGANLATAPALTAEGPGRALIAANTVQISNNPEQSNTGFVGRAFIPPYSGTVRVKWEIRSGDGTQVSASATVMHVGSCAGQTTTSMAYVKQSCDVRVTAGMPVTLGAFADSGSNTVYLKNVSLNYKVVNSNGETLTWEAESPV